MRSRLVKTALGIILLAAFAFFYQRFSTLQGTRHAPDFSLPTLVEGEKITLRQYRGRAVLVNFFATWCHNCRAEKKFLQDLRVKYRALPIISVLTFDPNADLQQLQGQQIAVDGDGTVARRYGVSWLPQTFLIDAAGYVVQHFKQPLNASRYAVLMDRMAAMQTARRR